MAVTETVAAIVDRDRERQLLAGLFDTVQFDRLPAGIPPLAPEADDEDDEVSAVPQVIRRPRSRGNLTRRYRS